MAGTYPVGYRLTVTIERRPYGPYAVVSWVPASHEEPEALSGLTSYEVLDDFAAFGFALLHEISSTPPSADPF